MSEREELTAAEQAALAATDQTTLQGRSGAKALRIIDALRADRAALVARAEAAERERDTNADAWTVQWNRANAAESECAVLRAEVERLNERVRIEVQTRADWAAAKEQQLAALRALLGRFKAGYNALPAIPHAGQWKALCVDTMAAIEAWPKEDDARLSSQPAEHLSEPSRRGAP